MAPKIIRHCERCGAERSSDTIRYCSKACRGAAVTKPLAELFWSKIDTSGECWTWTAAIDQKGYGCFMRRGVPTRAHRVAYELTHGPIPPGLLALHRCDNPPCCNPAHLFLGTHADNVRDMDRKGRRRNTPHHGGHNGMARLTASTVRLIRHERAQGATLSLLAKRFNVTMSTVSKVALGRSWKHVE